MEAELPVGSSASQKLRITMPNPESLKIEKGNGQPDEIIVGHQDPEVQPEPEAFPEEHVPLWRKISELEERIGDLEKQKEGSEKTKKEGAKTAVAENGNAEEGGAIEAKTQDSTSYDEPRDQLERLQEKKFSIAQEISKIDAELNRRKEDLSILTAAMVDPNKLKRGALNRIIIYLRKRFPRHRNKFPKPIEEAITEKEIDHLRDVLPDIRAEISRLTEEKRKREAFIYSLDQLEELRAAGLLHKSEEVKEPRWESGESIFHFEGEFDKWAPYPGGIVTQRGDEIFINNELRYKGQFNGWIPHPDGFVVVSGFRHYINGDRDKFITKWGDHSGYSDDHNKTAQFHPRGIVLKGTSGGVTRYFLYSEHDEQLVFRQKKENLGNIDSWQAGLKGIIFQVGDQLLLGLDNNRVLYSGKFDAWGPCLDSVVIQKDKKLLFVLGDKEEIVYEGAFDEWKPCRDGVVIRKGNDWIFYSSKDAKSVEERESSEKTEGREYSYEELEKMFDTQVDTLVARRYPEVSNMSEEEFRALIEPLREKLRGVMEGFLSEALEKEGHIPFVIVISKELVSLEKQVQLIEFETKKGSTRLDGSEDIITKDVVIPIERAYLVTGVEDGRAAKNISSKKAVKLFKKANRSGLTAEEGVSLVTQYPEILKKHYIILSGSRYGSGQVPFLCLDDDWPELDGISDFQSRSDSGLASCGDRIGF